MKRKITRIEETKQNQPHQQNKEYKDTEQAWYYIEEGNQNEEVTVVDTASKGQVTFKWTRKKSNQKRLFQNSVSFGTASVL